MAETTPTDPLESLVDKIDHRELTLYALEVLKSFRNVCVFRDYNANVNLICDANNLGIILSQIASLLPRFKIQISSLPNLLKQMNQSQDPSQSFKLLSEKITQIARLMEQFRPIFNPKDNGMTYGQQGDCSRLTKSSFQDLADLFQQLMNFICDPLCDSAMIFIKDFDSSKKLTNKFNLDQLIQNINHSLDQIDKLIEFSTRSPIKIVQDFLQEHTKEVNETIVWLSVLPLERWRGQNFFLLQPPDEKTVQIAQIIAIMMKLIRLFLKRLSKRDQTNTYFLLADLKHEQVHKLLNKIIYIAGSNIPDLKNLVACKTNSISDKQEKNFKNVKYCTNLINRFLLLSIPKKKLKGSSSPSSCLKIQFKIWLDNWIRQYTIAHQRLLSVRPSQHV